MFFIILLLCSAMGWSQDAFAKAELLFNSEQYEAAKPIYKSLLQDNSKDAVILRRLGDIESYAKRYEKAYPYYKKLLDLDSTNADYHFLYGGTLGLHAKESSNLRRWVTWTILNFILKKQLI
ncbi:TPR repeat precursor [Nonlabens ulvanivorans]|nr:TPR repeat precursor [Nonlabens ulvanivorans]